MGTRKSDAIAVFEALGDYRRRRSWFNFRCPYHRGEDYHFGVNFGSGRFSCFVCSVTGAVRDLLADLREGRVLPIRAGGMTGRLVLPASYERDTSSAVVDALERSTEPIETVEALKRFNAGYYEIGTTLAGDDDSLSLQEAKHYLQTRRFPVSILPVGVHSDMPGRVVFPFWMNGCLVYYTTRAFVNLPMKTTNPDMEHGWSGKGNVLWMIDNIRIDRDVCLTEGIFDCGAVWRVGRQAVPLLGKTISPTQKRLLKARSITSVVVMLDSDADAESKKLALYLFYSGFNVKRVQWPSVKGKEDPASVDDEVLLRLIDRSECLNLQVALALELECL